MTSETYYDIVNEAIELTVVTDEEAGTTYLEPRYRSILADNNLHLPGNMLPGDAKDEELWEILKLEVEKRNQQHNVAHALAEWAYHILSNTIDPELLSEENDLMNNIIEYMQLKQEVSDKKTELDNEEHELTQKEKIGSNKLPIGISFAKKEV